MSVTRRSETGLSLVEVIVSLMLLSVALMGIAQVFPKSRQAVQAGSNVSQAVALARQTLEEMRNRRYTTTVDELIPANYGPQGYGSIASFPSLRRTVNITDNQPEGTCTPPPPTACTKRVTVQVFYRDNTGVEQAVSLTTVFIR